MNVLMKIILGVIAVAVVFIIWIGSSKQFQTKVALKRQEKMGQGTLEERQAHCAKVGTFSDPVPYSAHLTVHYPVTPQACYRKEPDLAPKTNTISVQKLDGIEITPVFRIINEYNYTEADWTVFKSKIKSQQGNSQEIDAEAVPLFSANLRNHLQPGDVVRVTNCMGSGATCYYFTDRENMLYLMQLNMTDNLREAVYVDYQ